MKLELSMVVVRHSERRLEALLPTLDLAQSGPSLSELRDQLALRVMQQFEESKVAALAAYQMAPHAKIRHVEVDTVVRDRVESLKYELKGRVAVLLEKWPADEFWVATPVRLRAARFALRDPESLAPTLVRTLGQHCLKHHIDSLEGLSERGWARLEVLEVDAYAPSLLPRTPRSTAPRTPRARRPGAGVEKAKAHPSEEKPETPQEIEDRRRRARLEATTLRAACKDLSHGVEDDTLERAFGREALVEAVTDEIAGRQGLALVLVGPSGVGKTAILHEVTRRLWARQVAAGIRRDVWRIDGGRFIAGMSFVGQWEARARKLTTELVDTGDVLYADDLASLVFAGRTSTSDSNLARYLEPQLARGELTLIAESTPERFDKVREEAPTFASLFRVVRVPAMTAEATLGVLLGVLRNLESDDTAGAPPRLDPASLETLLAASARYRPSEALPGKAVRLLRRVVAGEGELEEPGQGQGQGQGGGGGAGAVRRFRPEHVHGTLREETGLPLFVLGAEKPRSRTRIHEDLSRMVAGQPEAIRAVTDVVLAAQAGLGDPDKPLATLLFVGPTGVGKTETAKALARYLLGGAERMVRFDMSEFVTGASIARLVGEAGGGGGELTSALRSQPVRVVLFDEIEKAHPRVFDALLQLLGEGRLTDAEGRTADARQAIVIMTSNLGVREAASQVGFVHAGDGARAHYLGAVRDFFRPEFFNRIDRVVPFTPLDKPALRQVVEHALEELLGRRGIRRGRVLVDVEPQLLDMLVEQAFDPRYGARPLRRALERRLTVPLAHHLATRRGDDFALVELFRRGEDLALAVRLLADAAPLPVRERRPWTVAGLIGAIAAVREELVRLRALPVMESRALDADLQSALGQLDARLVAIENEDIEGIGWGERVVAHAQAIKDSISRKWSGRPGSPREREGSREVAVQANEHLVVRRIAPLVEALEDELLLMSSRMRAVGEREADEITVLCESAGALDSDATVNAARSLPVDLLHADWWIEMGTTAGVAWKRCAIHEYPADDNPPGPVGTIRRVALSFHGAGLRELIAPLCGWVIVTGADEGRGAPLSPIRLELLEGSPTGAITARDARVAAVREARRQQVEAADAPAASPGIIVARARVDGQPGLMHVATGRPVEEAAAILATIVASASATTATTANWENPDCAPPASNASPDGGNEEAP